jgi:hypothetical protein
MTILRRASQCLLLVGILCGSFFGYKYYLRATFLPVRYPFITANAFCALAKHHFDHPQKWRILLTGQSFDPAAVQDGDIVYVKNSPFYLPRFFKNVHPKIKARYILLSHNGDDPVPGAYEQFLADDKIVAWAGCNVNLPNHPKMISLPIGIMGILNKKLPSDCQELWGRLLLDQRMGKLARKNFFYNNMNITTNTTERGRAVLAFKNQTFCFNAKVKPYADYLREMATYKFVLSPHGFGLDCYRTWEALMLGCIPVVKTSVLDCLYDGLPVLIVNDWEEATQEYLEQRYSQMSQQSYALDTLFIDYWVNLFRRRSLELLEQACASKVAL